jgi:hypothetical protein
VARKNVLITEENYYLQKLLAIVKAPTFEVRADLDDLAIANAEFGELDEEELRQFALGTAECRDGMMDLCHLDDARMTLEDWEKNWRRR